MTKSLKCREHNGNFTVEARRGRPPVRCTDENPCDGVKAKRNRVVTRDNTYSAAEKSASVRPTRKALAAERAALEEADTKKRLAKATGLRESQIVIKPAETNSEPRSQASPGLSAAKAAKADLEEMGWTAEGKGAGNLITVTATRGAESLVITFGVDGRLISQDYSLWHADSRKNAMPNRRLKFDPNEMTDGELVRAILGTKVTYWNSLAKAEESYVVSPDKLSIEHHFDARGNEDTGKRIIKFLDNNGGGFRHFHAEALLKVG